MFSLLWKNLKIWEKCKKKGKVKKMKEGNWKCGETVKKVGKKMKEGKKEKRMKELWKRNEKNCQNQN